MIEPILFIHGIVGNEDQYQPIIKYLHKRGASRFYKFGYSNKFGLTSIKVAAKELAEYIKDNIKEEKINIIAMSQGGIIALTYLKYFKNKNINKIFTICSPHKGSILAKILNLRGLIDLRPQSDLLKELEIFVKENNTKLYSIYTPFDLVVFPGWNAKSNYGIKKIIFSPGHTSSFSWPTTLKFIYKNLLW